jgi:beta-lactamase superfamily II metal-dependent hydrolase
MSRARKKIAAASTTRAPRNPARKKTPAVTQTARKTSPALTQDPAAGAVTGLRVRMYRVGFGDFFLLTVPTAAGPRHILIDCGVHAGDIGSMSEAIAQMAEETKSNLALVIMTHRHADHISGFASCKDVFSKFTVERVWMPWFEDPSKKEAVNFQSSLTALAAQLHAALAARADPESKELANMAQNIIGEPLAFGGGGSNAVALAVLHGGFSNRPQPNFYKAGDSPTLPRDLAEAGLTAQILGPPVDETLIAQMDNKNHQYLANSDGSLSGRIEPFAQAFKTDAGSYPEEAFEGDNSADKIARRITDLQPDLLAAKARQADNTLNNQSLVVLFTFRGKNLLFVGDAQWGNWENFLFGGALGTAGHTGLTDHSKSILGGIDFYKVGHHGSTNATPLDAVNALRDGCVAMCSTEPGCYGAPDKGTEVPRAPLLIALQKKTNNQLVRSDQIKADGKAPTGDLPNPPPIFKVPPTGLYIDYNF